MINNAPKQCLAKTRKGGFCKTPPVKGKKRCRMHGGAYGSGGQLGNKNALKHGYYTQESRDNRKELAKLVKLIKKLDDELKMA